VTAPLVRLELYDSVAEIVFASPPVNALSHAFIAELNEAIDAIPADARAVALTSKAPRVFMAGADLNFMATGSADELAAYERLVQGTFTRIERLDQPVIAAIDGACMGGGLEIALAADIRVVARSAKLGLPEATLGIIAAAGGTQRLVRSVGQGVARDMLLTGRRIDGAEAAAIGLASRLCEDGEASATAREIARDLASGAKEAIQASKRLALSASEIALEEGLRREREEYESVVGSANAREGIRAFVEKRDPDFS
jgi:enoyl-CoA hydratase/carnithine racemase